MKLRYTIARNSYQSNSDTEFSSNEDNQYNHWTTNSDEATDYGRIAYKVAALLNIETAGLPNVPFYSVRVFKVE